MTNRSGRRARHRRHKSRTKQAWRGPRYRMWLTVQARQWVSNERVTPAAAMARQGLDVEGMDRRKQWVVDAFLDLWGVPRPIPWR